jgi:hypothetical protein
MKIHIEFIMLENVESKIIDMPTAPRMGEYVSLAYDTPVLIDGTSIIETLFEVVSICHYPYNSKFDVSIGIRPVNKF